MFVYETDLLIGLTRGWTMRKMSEASCWSSRSPMTANSQLDLPGNHSASHPRTHTHTRFLEKFNNDLSYFAIVLQWHQCSSLRWLSRHERQLMLLLKGRRIWWTIKLTFHVFGCLICISSALLTSAVAQCLHVQSGHFIYSSRENTRRVCRAGRICRRTENLLWCAHLLCFGFSQ